jgi:hypothetical protein
VRRGDEAPGRFSWWGGASPAQKQIPRFARDDKRRFFDNPLEEEFGCDVEAAAEAERGKLETRKQKLEMGRSGEKEKERFLALLGMTREGGSRTDLEKEFGGDVEAAAEAFDVVLIEFALAA